MSRINSLFIAIILIIGPQLKSFAQNHPSSFADLAEKLMPSVVNISTTQIITTRNNPFPFEFPPGSPFEDMFKEFGTPQERQSAALGSGFIIEKEGIIVILSSPSGAGKTTLVKALEYEVEFVDYKFTTERAKYLRDLIDQKNDLSSINEPFYTCVYEKWNSGEMPLSEASTICSLKFQQN